MHRLAIEELDDSLQLSEESQEYNSCTMVCESDEKSSVSREQVSQLDVDDVINLDSDEDRIAGL